MPARDDLIAEISHILDDLESQKQEWHQRWIAQKVCQNHAGGLKSKDEEHRSFWFYCGYETAMDVIGEVIKKRTGAGGGGDDSDDRAPTLPGFKHLQVYYRTSRKTEDGKVELIAKHIETMSDEEVLRKIQQLRKQAKALLDHAKELEKYLRNRQARLGVA